MWQAHRAVLSRPRSGAGLALASLLACAGWILAPGCSAWTEPAPPAGEDSGDEADAATGLEAEPDTRTEAEKLADKLALHVECLQRSVGHIEDSWDRYAERVAEDGRPESKKVAPYLYEIESELEPCERAAAESAELPPARPELERAQRAYLDASSAFAALTVQLHAYYEREGWKEDEWAKSIELAPKMREAWAAWEPARDAFEDLLKDERRKSDQAMLDVIGEREGKTLRWHALRLRAVAEDLASCVETSEREACRPAATALAEAHRAFETAHDGDPEAARVFWMSSYRASAAELARTSEAFVAKPKAKGKGKPSADADDVELAWTRMDRDFAHLDFDFPG